MAPQDSDQNFRDSVALSRLVDPPPTLENLARHTGVPYEDVRAVSQATRQWRAALGLRVLHLAARGERRHHHYGIPDRTDGDLVPVPKLKAKSLSLAQPHRHGHGVESFEAIAFERLEKCAGFVCGYSGPETDSGPNRVQIWSGTGIRTLYLAVNRSLRPVQKWRLKFPECR